MSQPYPPTMRNQQTFSTEMNYYAADLSNHQGPIGNTDPTTVEMFTPHVASQLVHETAPEIRSKHGAQPYQNRGTLGRQKKRPVYCNNCGKHFSRYEDLDRHLKTASIHREGLTFYCNVCGAECSRSDVLRKHQKKFHKAETFSEKMFQQ